MTASRVLSCDLGLTRRGAGDPFSLEVAFEVPPGVTVLFGESGSGKSTLLQCIAGLLVPERGRVALGDEVWLDRARGIDVAVERRRVAYLFQSLALFPHLTALANVAYGIDRRRPRAERRQRARDLLARFHVAHLAERRPRTFSGGEAQRVALARSVAMQPRVLLLDEPFSALDRELRDKLSREVRDLVVELGLPTLFVTHHHQEALALGDRMVRMGRGRVTAVGRVEDLLES